MQRTPNLLLMHRRDGWRVGNASHTLRVLLRRAGAADGHYVRELSLVPDTAFRLGASHVRVLASWQGQLMLEETIGLGSGGKAQIWRYDGARLLRNGSPLVKCGDESLRETLRTLWNQVAPPGWGLGGDLSLGGNLYCGMRLGVAGVPVDAYRVQRADGGFRLRVLNGDPGSLGFLAQSDRIAAWAAPDLHPYSGEQQARALDAIRSGAWAGTRFEGATEQGVADIPNLKDDFAPSYFLHRLGIASGAALMLVQLALLIELTEIARRRHRRHAVEGRGEYRRVMLGWFSYFLIYGTAALLGAHILVSWGTNTGLLPVMGQPMPFVSAAGSHLGFFALPLLLIAIVLDEESVRVQAL